MIGLLPKCLNINDQEWAIRSDYRVALLLFQALADPDLDERTKSYVVLDSLYVAFDRMPAGYYQEAVAQAMWYLSRGDSAEHEQRIKLLDWEQDEQLIFPAVNKIAGREVRELEYMHWWTFLGYFNEIGEGLFSSVVGIRSKKSKGKKLEKHEQEFYRNNKHLIDFKQKYSDEEKEEIDRWNEMLG